MQLFRLSPWLVAIGLTAVALVVLIPLQSGKGKVSNSLILRTKAQQLMSARLAAWQDGIDDRDVANLVEQNYFSADFLSSLLAPSGPRTISWVKSASNNWPSTLLGAGGEPPVLPPAEEPYRLGSLIVLPLSATSDPREWMLVVLDVPDTSGDNVVVVSGQPEWSGDPADRGAPLKPASTKLERSAFDRSVSRTIGSSLVAKRSWDAALAEQDRIRALRGAPPLGDLRALPDLLHLSPASD